MQDYNDISEATTALHLSVLPTNKFIQFLHHCLLSTILTFSHVAHSCPYCRPDGSRSFHSHY